MIFICWPNLKDVVLHNTIVWNPANYSNWLPSQERHSHKWWSLQFCLLWPHVYLYLHYPVMNIWVSMVTQLQRIFGCRPRNGLSKPVSRADSNVVCHMWRMQSLLSLALAPWEVRLVVGQISESPTGHVGKCATQLAKKRAAVSWCMMLVFFHHDENEREHVQGDTEVSSWITGASGTSVLNYLEGQFA